MKLKYYDLHNTLKQSNLGINNTTDFKSLKEYKKEKNSYFKKLLGKKIRGRMKSLPLYRKNAR